MENSKIENGKNVKTVNTIFDSDSDLHRALRCADGMVSDNSSLVPLFLSTGKSVLIQNVDIDWHIGKEEQDEYLHSDVINFGSRLITIDEFEREYPEYYVYWLPHRNEYMNSRYILVHDLEFGTSNFLNALYETDIEHAQAKFVMNIPVEDGVNDGVRLYHAPCRIGNKLLFAPARARRWAFYDLRTSQWSYEDIPEELYPTKGYRAAFGSRLIYDDELLFMPGESGAIAKYNIITGNITYHREWFVHLRDGIRNVDWGIISGFLAYKDSLLLVSMHTNIIMEISPKTMKVKNIHKAGDADCGYGMACLIPNTDTVYLIKVRKSGMEAIVKWDIHSGNTIEITDLPIKLVEEGTQNAIHGLIYWKDILYITPLQGDSILKLDLSTDMVTRHPLNPEFDFFKRKSKYYEGWAKDLALPFMMFNAKRMSYLAQLPYDYGLADIVLETGEISNRRKWRVKGVEELYKTIPRNDVGYIGETYFFNVENFVDGLVNDAAFLSENCETKNFADKPVESNGQRIYDYVKKLVGI